MNAPSSSILERFGLDYLTGSPNSPTQSNVETDVSQGVLPTGLEPILASMGNRVISILQGSKDSSSSLFALAESTGLRVDGLLAVMQYLVQKNLVVKTQELPSGNDTYAISNIAKE